jgi:hypothetical protein
MSPLKCCASLILCLQLYHRELKTLRRQERSDREADRFVALRQERSKRFSGMVPLHGVTR